MAYPIFAVVRVLLAIALVFTAVYGAFVFLQRGDVSAFVTVLAGTVLLVAVLALIWVRFIVAYARWTSLARTNGWKNALVLRVGSHLVDFLAEQARDRGRLPPTKGFPLSSVGVRWDSEGIVFADPRKTGNVIGTIPWTSLASVESGHRTIQGVRYPTFVVNFINGLPISAVVGSGRSWGVYPAGAKQVAQLAGVRST